MNRGMSMKQKAYRFSPKISSLKEVGKILKVLGQCIGQQLRVRVSVPGGEPDELVIGEVQEIYEESGVLVLLMTHVTCKSVKVVVERETYNIALKVICKIVVPRVKSLPTKKAAV